MWTQYPMEQALAQHEQLLAAATKARMLQLLPQSQWTDLKKERQTMPANNLLLERTSSNQARQAENGATKHTRIIVTHYGGLDALQVVEEERPEPKAGEVRISVLAAGVALPDIMAREGIHPETPPVPFTPGWDLVGVVDQLGAGVTGIEPGQIVAALPIHGAYAEFVCLPQAELVPVPAGVDAAEAVSLVLNYITAYQMLHRSAKVKPGQRVLIRGATGGVGTALMQLGRLAGLEMYGTCSARNAQAVTDLGGIPIDYRTQDFVEEIHRLTGEGVDAVFDPIGGQHIWHSRQALRPGGRVVGYGNTTTLRGEGLAAGRPGRRNRLHGLPIYALYIAGGWLLPGRKRVVPYSIQTLKRLKPAWFRQDLSALLDLLQQGQIKPLIAQRFPLAEARQAQELLEKGGVTGKLVLVRDGSALESEADK
ncbi:MAG: medium chain dehydrogenase/reductase family protein [Caldilineaceae bacterium]